MIVERQVFKVKPGHVNDTVEVLQEMWKLVDPVPSRIYTVIAGPHYTVYLDLEFESFEQREKWWADMNPKVAPLMDRWYALVDAGGGIELLRPVE